MRLTKKALELINTVPVRNKLSSLFGVTEMAVIRYIKANENNSKLTTAGALNLIESETGLSQAEILEHENAPVTT